MNNYSFSEDLEEFQNIIDVDFKNLSFLIEALSHSSYLNEHPVFKNQYGLTDGHNERLEYLGDSILGHAVAENLYSNHPGREGDLTAVKMHFVSGKKLAEISGTLGLDKILIVGNGEINNESGREKRIADSLEALIAAINLDQGYEKAKKFIDKFFLCDLDNVLKNLDKTKILDNPVGYLQEHCVDMGYGEPVYKELHRFGPDHSPTFSFEVKIGGERSAKGIGKNIPATKKDAAMNALKLYVFGDAPDFQTD
jgi:ribonuclease-3